MVGGGITVPFLSDVGVHVRFLLALPLLIAAEVIVHRNMQPIIGQLLHRGIVRQDALPRFHACVDSAMRLRNSILAEILLIAFVYTAGHHVWKQQLALHTATWYATVVDGVLQLLTSRVLVYLREYPDLPIHLPALVFPPVYLVPLPLAGVAAEYPSHPDPPRSSR